MRKFGPRLQDNDGLKFMKRAAFSGLVGRRGGFTLKKTNKETDMRSILLAGAALFVLSQAAMAQTRNSTQPQSGAA